MRTRIEDILKEKNLTKSYLADKLGFARQNFNAMFKNPTLQRLEDAANILNVSVAELLDEDTHNKCSDFAAFIRYKGVHYTADTLKEFLKQVEEIKTIAR
nr:MAG TPA: Cro/C1-type HTH DNA-binding domain protein [Caudoviricetes sp.]